MKIITPDENSSKGTQIPHGENKKLIMFKLRSSQLIFVDVVCPHKKKNIYIYTTKKILFTFEINIA